VSYIDSFEGKTLFLDTVSFIYYVEKHPKFLSILRDFFLRLDQGRFIAFTSTVTLAEVLVLPQRRKRMDLVEEYRSLLKIGIHLTQPVPMYSNVTLFLCGMTICVSLQNKDATISVTHIVP